MAVEIRVPADTPSTDTVDPAAERAQQRATQAANAAAFATGRQQRANADQQAYTRELEGDLVAGALDRVELESADAEQRLAVAMASGDASGAARIQNELTDITYRKNVLRDGLEEMRGGRREPAPQDVSGGGPVRDPVRQQPQQPQRPANVEQVLASLPGLTNAEREWCRQHPEALLDPNNQLRMNIAFQDAAARGIQRGSEEYFQFFEDRMGYGGDRSRRETRDADEYDGVDAGGGVRVAAPPSRNRSSGGGRQLREGQVMLSQAERDAARFSGISEVEYARQKVRLHQEKTQGLYAMHETK